jgi:hypothetical protein
MCRVGTPNTTVHAVQNKNRNLISTPRTVFKDVPRLPFSAAAAAEKGQGDEVTARANEPRNKMFPIDPMTSSRLTKIFANASCNFIDHRPERTTYPTS